MSTQQTPGDQSSNSADSSSKAKKLSTTPPPAPTSAKKTSTSVTKKTTKKSTKKTKKKAGESSPPPAPPREGRVVNVIPASMLSASVPTAPKKIKPQYASFRSSRKSLVNPRRVRGGVKLRHKAGETPQRLGHSEIVAGCRDRRGGRSLHRWY